MKHFFFVMLLSSVAVTSHAHAQDATQPARTPAPATAPASAFDAELDAIDRKALAHQDLTADFVQEKHSPLLRKPLVSRGTVMAKGPLTLWVTAEPEPSRMSIDSRWVRLYYPKQKVVEEYPVDGRLGAMASSPLPALQDIRKNFTLSPDAGAGLDPVEPAGNTRALRLEPVEALRPYVGFVRVLLDADRGLVLAFEVTDPDGERTLVRFSNLQPDRGLSDDALMLDTPAGTKVVRPVGDAMPAPQQ
ncbi:MAG TPA: outer membrane lipoprotein carrier protein LolA [Tepidisphaeraceae bacterium]|jgi:outer membrane lipoprotein-sorting protein|nr:outer membrane lipoprotein carrier protein LolA [Tepidisphaeraceae bacterium]